MNKIDIRNYIKYCFKCVNPKLLAIEADAVEKSVIKLLSDCAVESPLVLLYWSLPDELPTHHLVEYLYSEGVAVVLPVVVGDGMVLRRYDGAASMKEGPFGILEPHGDLVKPEDLDVAFIPGRAFTRDGVRLGRGRGYYDRVLPLVRCPKIGVCYSFQVLDSLPCEPHDCAVDSLLL